MKTTSIILAALLFSTGVLLAQNTNKPVTVRIKKVENINGVEKITDTTYTTTDVSHLKAANGRHVIESNCSQEGKTKKTVIVTNETNGDGKNVMIMNSEDGMDEQVERALKEVGVDGHAGGMSQMIMVDVDSKAVDEKGEKKTTKIVVIKKIKITDPTAEETKLLGKQNGKGDDELVLDKMNFYPNPSNGKFNLSFQLPDKGDTEVTLLNIEGKSIYNEKLPAFSGNYNKEIDISQNPKGIYFVKIQQGEHTVVKKIVLE